jgi:hypothetical protein
VGGSKEKKGRKETNTNNGEATALGYSFFLKKSVGTNSEILGEISLSIE